MRTAQDLDLPTSAREDDDAYEEFLRGARAARSARRRRAGRRDPADRARRARRRGGARAPDLDGQAVNAPADAPRTRVVVAWALYDLANTIYSAIVVTTFLPDLLETRYGASSWLFYATSATLLASALVSTAFGARVDRTGRARPGLDGFTLLCIGATAALYPCAGLGRASRCSCCTRSACSATRPRSRSTTRCCRSSRRRTAAAGSRASAPRSATRGSRSRSSWGARCREGALGLEGTFLLCAGLFLVGTVPLWLLVKDDPARARAAAGPRVRLIDSLRWVASQPTLRLLLLANFVCGRRDEHAHRARRPLLQELRRARRRSRGGRHGRPVDDGARRRARRREARGPRAPRPRLRDRRGPARRGPVRVGGRAARARLDRGARRHGRGRRRHDVDRRAAAGDRGGAAGALRRGPRALRRHDEGQHRRHDAVRGARATTSATASRCWCRP